MFEITQYVWYLAFQDGPAEGDKTYDTEEEAKAALKRFPKELRKSTCVMQRVNARFQLVRLPK